jgi:hypothetical protein
MHNIIEGPERTSHLGDFAEHGKSIFPTGQRWDIKKGSRNTFVFEYPVQSACWLLVRAADIPYWGTEIFFGVDDQDAE